MLLGTLGNSLLRNLLTGKGTIRTGKGRFRAGENLLMPPNSLINLEIEIL